MVNPGRTRYSSLHTLSWALGFFGSILLVSAAFLVEQVFAVKTGRPVNWVDLIYMTLLTAIAVRAARLGVVLDGSEIFVRGYFRTHRLLCTEVATISTVDYLGPFWLSSESLKNLRLDLRSGGSVNIWGLSGRDSCLGKIRKELLLDIRRRTLVSSRGDHSL